jgi:hypothetical protein
MLRKRILLIVAATTVALVFAVNAQASSKQLWYSQRVDQIGSSIAGKSVQILGEDDWNEWASFLPGDDPRAVLGFTYPLVDSSSVLYQKIFINPDLWPTLSKAAVTGAEGSGSSRYTTAVAIMSLTHEAYHQRLTSLDESRVNACALKSIPGRARPRVRRAADRYRQAQRAFEGACPVPGSVPSQVGLPLPVEDRLPLRHEHSTEPRLPGVPGRRPGLLQPPASAVQRGDVLVAPA